MNGWIKLHRKIALTDNWLAEPFTRGQALVDLFILANHKPGYVRVRGERIDLERGQCGWSEVKLAERWKWSRGKVRRFFSELEKDGIISRKTDNRKTVITICNYLHYQTGDTADGTADDTADGQQTDSRRYSNKNDKNDKNEKKRVEKNDFSEFLSEAFASYNHLAEQLGLPRAQVLTDTRKKKLLARLKSCNGIEGWKFALQQLSKSGYCQGDNGRGWRADFDFLLQEKSFTKLMEGSYADRKPKNDVDEFFAELKENAQ